MLLSFFNQNNLISGFFIDNSNLIENNFARLSYGVAVTDINDDDKFEFIITGYKYENLALSYVKGKLKNINKEIIFADKNRKAIGVVACDVDSDGKEEIYFLNTDSFSGKKNIADRLLNEEKNSFYDMFEDRVNRKSINLTAGRSLACIDNNGDGKYGVYVSNYGGPSRLYKVLKNKIIDLAPELNMDKITGGRAVVAGHILSNKVDIFASNERGPNFLYKNLKGNFINVAKQYGTEDKYQNGRGAALSDILYRGNLDIISGNWKGYHRIYILRKKKFIDLAEPIFNRPTKLRTLISADFDNDGYDEIFMNNIGESNKLFKIKDNGILEQIKLDKAKLPNGYGTGAAVSDIDNDGILELLIASGENLKQPLKLFKANVDKNNSYLRIKPLNKKGSYARGSTVTLISNLRTHSKTIDAGSGYLCQMEPIAHFGIRKKEKISKVSIKWTDGTIKNIKINSLNKTITVRQ